MISAFCFSVNLYFHKSLNQLKLPHFLIELMYQSYNLYLSDNLKKLIRKGKKNLFFGKNSAPNWDIKSINFFILLLFKDLSPKIFKFKFGVDVIIPIINLASVPEFPKFNFELFLHL